MSKSKKDTGTLAKGLKILAVIGDFPNGARFVDVQRRTEYSLSTVHRVLATLVEYDFLEHNSEQRLYTLGMRIFELSHRVTSVQNISKIALPIMKKLANETEEMVSLNVLDRKEVLVLERADPETQIQVIAKIGSREHLHSTSTGKIILANSSEDEIRTLLSGANLKAVTHNTITKKSILLDELKEVRKNGFAISNEENQVGVRSISVKVPTRPGQREAALSLAAPSFSKSVDELINQLPRLLAAADTLGNRLSL